MSGLPKKLVADPPAHEAVRRILLTHERYRSRGNSRLGRQVGIALRAEGAAHDFGEDVDMRSQALFRILTGGDDDDVALDEAIRTLDALARDNPFLGWKFDVFVGEVRSKRERTMEISAAHELDD